MKEDLKTVALGTSKINYLDPRISVSWCKRHEVRPLHALVECLGSSAWLSGPCALGPCALTCSPAGTTPAIAELVC